MALSEFYLPRSIKSASMYAVPKIEYAIGLPDNSLTDGPFTTFQHALDTIPDNTYAILYMVVCSPISMQLVPMYRWREGTGMWQRIMKKYFYYHNIVTNEIEVLREDACIDRDKQILLKLLFTYTQTELYDVCKIRFGSDFITTAELPDSIKLLKRNAETRTTLPSTCPACGSDNVLRQCLSETRSTPFGAKVDILITNNTCAVCGCSGDFEGVNSAVEEQAQKSLREIEVQIHLEYLRSLNLVYAGVERALELPQGCMKSWEEKKTSPTCAEITLLRFLFCFPWVIDVADKNYCIDLDVSRKEEFLNLLKK